MFKLSVNVEQPVMHGYVQAPGFARISQPAIALHCLNPFLMSTLIKVNLMTKTAMDYVKFKELHFLCLVISWTLNFDMIL